jgi:hypothetical protein
MVEGGEIGLILQDTLFCWGREHCANSKIVSPMLKGVLGLFHVTTSHTNDGVVSQNLPCIRDVHIVLAQVDAFSSGCNSNVNPVVDQERNAILPRDSV